MGLDRLQVETLHIPKHRTYRRRVLAGCTIAALGLATFAYGEDAPSTGAAFSSATAPAPQITKTEAERAFAQAMFICLGSRLSGQMIKDAPKDIRDPFAAATDGDRAYTGVQLRDDEPVWVSRRLGHLLLILEPSSDSCQVHGAQIPVDASFQLVRDAIKQKLSDQFSAVELKPGVSPITYQFEYVAGGARYVVHMEGTEPGHIKSPKPGEPGIDLPVSVLFGAVARQSVTDAPAFR